MFYTKQSGCMKDVLKETTENRTYNRQKLRLKKGYLKFFTGKITKKRQFSLNLRNFLFTLQLELCPIGTCR
jgi:hypothetical protein